MCVLGYPSFNKHVFDTSYLPGFWNSEVNRTMFLSSSSSLSGGGGREVDQECVNGVKPSSSNMYWAQEQQKRLEVQGRLPGESDMTVIGSLSFVICSSKGSTYKRIKIGHLHNLYGALCLNSIFIVIRQLIPSFLL